MLVNHYLAQLRSLRSQSNESCLARPTLIDLNLNELHYYPFVVNLDRCSGSCSTLDDLPRRLSVLNRMAEVNLNVYNMITKINELKPSPKHISC